MQIRKSAGGQVHAPVLSEVGGVKRRDTAPDSSPQVLVMEDDDPSDNRPPTSDASASNRQLLRLQAFCRSVQPISLPPRAVHIAAATPAVSAGAVDESPPATWGWSPSSRGSGNRVSDPHSQTHLNYSRTAMWSPWKGVLPPSARAKRAQSNVSSKTPSSGPPPDRSRPNLIKAPFTFRAKYPVRDVVEATAGPEQVVDLTGDDDVVDNEEPEVSSESVRPRDASSDDPAAVLGAQVIVIEDDQDAGSGQAVQEPMDDRYQRAVLRDSGQSEVAAVKSKRSRKRRRRRESFTGGERMSLRLRRFLSLRREPRVLSPPPINESREGWLRLFFADVETISHHRNSDTDDDVGMEVTPDKPVPSIRSVLEVHISNVLTDVDAAELIEVMSAAGLAVAKVLIKVHKNQTSKGGAIVWIDLWSHNFDTENIIRCLGNLEVRSQKILFKVAGDDDQECNTTKPQSLSNSEVLCRICTGDHLEGIPAFKLIVNERYLEDCPGVSKEAPKLSFQTTLMVSSNDYDALFESPSAICSLCRADGHTLCLKPPISFLNR